MAGGAALGAIRSGTAMGSAASTAYKLGQETSGSTSFGAGMSGVARAGSSALRQKAGAALGISEAASSGRDAAWTALNGGATGAASSGLGDQQPQWARSLKRQQDMRHHRQVAMHTLREGERGGGSAIPDIKEKDD